MRKLSLEEIERFASREGVKRIAVENFLMSMGSVARDVSLNLHQDAGLYRWNSKTVKAIQDGILLAEFSEEESGEDQSVPETNSGEFPW